MFLEYNVIMFKTISQIAKKIDWLMKNIYLYIMLTFFNWHLTFFPKSIKVLFFFAGLRLVQMNTFVIFCWFNWGFNICLPTKASSNVSENKGTQIVLLGWKKKQTGNEKDIKKKPHLSTSVCERVCVCVVCYPPGFCFWLFLQWFIALAIAIQCICTV